MSELEESTKNAAEEVLAKSSQQMSLLALTDLGRGKIMDPYMA